MKVLLITNLYPSSQEPTRGVFNANSFGALSRYCETRVVVPVCWWKRLRRPRELFSVPLESPAGIAALYPTYWPVPQSPRTHVRAMYAALRTPLQHLRREFPFDVIFAAFAYPDGAAAALLARDMDCPLVIKTLGSDINELANRPALRREVQWALGRAERVIAVSAALRERIIELGVAPERIIMAHNGVDGTRFTIRDRRQARISLGLPLDRSLACYVGNLTAEKGVDVLVEAMGYLRRQGRCDVDLAVLGSGVMDERLHSLVRELGLEDRIRFLGRRPNAEISDWLAACDVFCLPSRREGCPNVVLEALASGRPVVATNVGGVPELLDNRYGILTPVDDPEALAEGLTCALRREWDPGKLRGSVPSLSWDGVARVYRQALEAATRGPWRLHQSA